MSTTAPLPDKRPEPVLEAAQVTRWVGLGGPLLVALLTTLGGLTAEEANTGLALGTGAALAVLGGVNFVVATAQARKARAQVTPKDDPRADDGERLAPASEVFKEGYEEGYQAGQRSADLESQPVKASAEAEPVSAEREVDLARREVTASRRALVDAEYDGDPERIAEARERNVEAVRRLHEITGAIEAKPAEPLVAQDALLDDEGKPIS